MLTKYRSACSRRTGKGAHEGPGSAALPAWVGSTDIRFQSKVISLAGVSRAEVSLLDGRLRPDVVVQPQIEGWGNTPLYVEIRVTHAVDALKTSLIREGRFSVIEIDLSDATDDVIIDEQEFRQLVLTSDHNRSWIHLDVAAYMSTELGQCVYDVRHAADELFEVKTSGGGSVLVRRQLVYRHDPDGTVHSMHIELEQWMIAGQRVTDGEGTPVPYAPGLYLRATTGRNLWSRNSWFKTRLVPLAMRGWERQMRLF